MDPSSSASAAQEEEAEDELDGGFDDFTIASSWEMVIATVEATAREWQASGTAGLLVSGAVRLAGSKTLHRIHKEISFGKKSYVIILFFHSGGGTGSKTEEWPLGLHHLQLWFGVQDFMVVAPVSHSGVILDAPEATMILSTVAIALSSCGSSWPAFVPVHDPTRKAYKGVQGTNSSYSITFEADRIGSWVPVRFMHLEGLYELFASKVAFTAPNFSAVPALKVEFTMRLTYQTPSSGFGADEPPWDEDLPWGDWHSVCDPIKGFELVAIWNKRFVNHSWEMAEYENASTFDADEWSLSPIFSEKKKKEEQDEEGFAGRLEALVRAFYVCGEAQFMEDFLNSVKSEEDMLRETFTVPPPSVLERVLKDLFYGASVPSGEGFSFRTHGSSIKGAPRDSLFGRFCLQALRFGSCNIRAISELWLEFVREVRWCWDECQPLPRLSPNDPPDLATCLLHQKLQLLALCIKLKADEVAKEATESKVDAGHDLGDVTDGQKAISVNEDSIDSQNSEELSILGVSEERQAGSTYFTPRDSEVSTEVSDQSVSGLNENNSTDEMESLFTPPLEERKPSSQNRVPGNEVWDSGDEDDEVWEPFETVHEIVDAPKELKVSRRGSSGPFKNLMLLKVEKRLHAPLVQRPQVMTEDMLLEREQAIAALSRSPSEKMACIRLQTEELASDMGAFKAANPGGVFEDFVRWHSPSDWVVDNSPKDGEEDSVSRNMDDSKGEWPPRGRLSYEMSSPGNTWNQIWGQIAAEPASEQKPLFDYQREGEKVMHYLDTLRPRQLLGQMLCTAFMASVDALRRTGTGSLSKNVNSQLQELCASLDLILQPLSSLCGIGVPSKEDVDTWHKDLLRLCALLGDVETNVFMAASLFQKLKLTPHLMEALFTSFMDDVDGESFTHACVQNTANDSKGGSNDSNNPREAVADLFPLSSTSQSMGKSMRMGNFLNGNEPDVRELKFQCYEEDLYKRTGTSRHERKQKSKMFSHRMYVCGTADDLQVGLAVVSRD